VKETWDGGVLPDPLQPKTYVLFPGFTQKVFKYDMSSQVFVMNDQPDATYGEGRRRDSYLVQSSEGQDMRISLNIRWRRDPDSWWTCTRPSAATWRKRSSGPS
jgi:hypothetical protein